jgi:hypothetical protein
VGESSGMVGTFVGQDFQILVLSLSKQTQRVARSMPTKQVTALVFVMPTLMGAYRM